MFTEKTACPKEGNFTLKNLIFWTINSETCIMNECLSYFACWCTLMLVYLSDGVWIWVIQNL